MPVRQNKSVRQPRVKGLWCLEQVSAQVKMGPRLAHFDWDAASSACTDACMPRMRHRRSPEAPIASHVLGAQDAAAGLVQVSGRLEIHMVQPDRAQQVLRQRLGGLRRCSGPAGVSARGLGSEAAVARARLLQPLPAACPPRTCPSSSTARSTIRLLVAPCRQGGMDGMGGTAGWRLRHAAGARRTLLHAPPAHRHQVGHAGGHAAAADVHIHLQRGEYGWMKNRDGCGVELPGCGSTGAAQAAVAAQTSAAIHRCRIFHPPPGSWAPASTWWSASGPGSRAWCPQTDG